MFKDGPLAGGSIEAGVLEGRPPMTLDTPADDGSTCRYRLDGWARADDPRCTRSCVASRRPVRSRVSPHPRLRGLTVPEYPNMSPPEPAGPRYSARIALSCERGHAPGQVLHALQELRQVIDDRLRDDLGGRYDRHSAQSVGTDKLTVTFTLRAATHADAIRSAGLAAGTLAELLTDNAAAVDLSGIALVVRAQ